MIESILIANRGEIACRIIRTCRRLGIRSIAVYSDADINLPHVKLADEAVYIGASEVKQSYLNADKIIAAAKKTQATAIHPGYGFLSENGTFAKRLDAESIIFIGPNPNAIEWMGSKSKAKEIAGKHDVPLVPGYQGEDQSLERFLKEALAIGFPVLLKAAAGGGGKGMRIVNAAEGLEEAFAGAKREALNAFGNDELLIEKYFASARHIEMQIFGDKHGNAIHLLERECTIQRRYQKIFEESPSPVLTEEQRKDMGEAAVRMAKALNYDNAGTVEFIYSDGKFYFLEVNTRLQVEHPVTEAVTGLDLVQLQIEVAEGKVLGLNQSDIKANGYALECRLYAEDAANNFRPTTGKLLAWQTPELEGLRYDSGIEAGSEISIYYDPMISKVIAHAADRNTAIRRMNYALRNLVCLGTTTNHSFLLDILNHPQFQSGDYDTHFIASKMDLVKDGAHSTASIHSALIAATLYRWQQNETERKGLKNIPANWRNNFYQPATISFFENGSEHNVRYTNKGTQFVFEINNEPLQVKFINAISGSSISAEIDGHLQQFNLVESNGIYYVQHFSFPQIQLQITERFPIAEKEKVKGGYSSPMPASVVKILVTSGQQVQSGQSLLVISSMKMENTVVADDAGIVSEIYVAEGENIEAGKLLLKITDNE